MVSTHLKNIRQNWIISLGRGENKTCLKPPPRNKPHIESLGIGIVKNVYNRLKADFPVEMTEKMAFELNSVPSWVRVHYTIYTRWAPNDRYKWSDISPISRLQKPQVTHLF